MLIAPMKASLYQSAGRRAAPGRGMSLVELMVGITIGLFIVAAAVTLVAGQLSDNRKLTSEVQMQQDLRASADIITRQLRRAGSLGVVTSEARVATAEQPEVLPSALASPLMAAGLPSSQIVFAYYYKPGDEGPYGFQLNAGVIQTLMGGTWQDLTDSRTMRVTRFVIDFPATTGALPESDPLPCLVPCADGSSSCWPSMAPRVLEVTIRAEAKNDPSVVRELTSRVRLRNDLLRFNGPNPAQLCPVG